MQELNDDVKYNNQQFQDISNVISSYKPSLLKGLLHRFEPIRFMFDIKSKRHSVNNIDYCNKIKFELDDEIDMNNETVISIVDILNKLLSHVMYNTDFIQTRTNVEYDDDELFHHLKSEDLVSEIFYWEEYTETEEYIIDWINRVPDEALKNYEEYKEILKCFETIKRKISIWTNNIPDDIMKLSFELIEQLFNVIKNNINDYKRIYEIKIDDELFKKRLYVDVVDLITEHLMLNNDIIICLDEIAILYVQELYKYREYNNYGDGWRPFWWKDEYEKYFIVE